MSISFKRLRRFSKGFTLVEMLTVTAIIFVITAFIIFQQQKFNSSTLLRSLTYSVALSIRQAQIYGTSVRGYASGSNTLFGSGYGVYLSPSAACATGVNGSCFFMYADPSGPTSNGQRASDGTEDVSPPSPFKLGRGYIISKVCVKAGSASALCSSDAVSPISAVHVFFRRPNPDACITTNLVTTGCGPGQASGYSAAYIEIKATNNNNTRSVKVSSTGQISICSPNLADITTC